MAANDPNFPSAGCLPATAVVVFMLVVLGGLFALIGYAFKLIG
jgi:hypothetical protein